MFGVRVFAAQNIYLSTLSIYLFMHSYALQIIFWGEFGFFLGNSPPDVPRINTE